MRSFYISKENFVVGHQFGVVKITEITESTCKIGDSEFIHFPLCGEICVKEIAKEEKQAATPEINIDNISKVVNPAKIMNEKFVRQDVDDLKGIRLTPEKMEKTWAQHKLEAKSRKKLKKILDTI